MDFLLGGGDFSKPADTSFLGRAVRNHSLSHQLYFFKKACKKKKERCDIWLQEEFGDMP